MATRLLEQIHGPSDVKRLSLEELEQLCDEIRKKILLTVSETENHLASNLKVVELTVVLHYVFETPKDKFV